MERYYANEDVRNYYTGNKPLWEHSHPSYPEPRPYAFHVQRQTDTILADYAQNIYVRGWIGVWIFNFTHWIASEEEMAHGALCEIARLKKEVAA